MLGVSGPSCEGVLSIGKVLFYYKFRFVEPRTFLSIYLLTFCLIYILTVRNLSLRSQKLLTRDTPCLFDETESASYSFGWIYAPKFDDSIKCISDNFSVFLLWSLSISIRLSCLITQKAPSFNLSVHTVYYFFRETRPTGIPALPLYPV